ncbi:aminodeoxychorismate lyase [Pantoea sp. JGM49]|uniref:aminodeoxychorismate lyase n=1 Tax=unclassified Pantoea TaxID=2630326 RepID=UPI000BCC1EDD|nr:MULTISPECIES: aminodeoxychorismate lyase [unclassified Pantoea]MBS0879122.1 aminodeoxychorismate lyase [Pantoea sp. JGM49]MDF7628278.1 aminodeoxychorismate lyase [Erwiniaceae bacterium L1_55_4]MDI9277817.1 aminodeoxychorismate lyase [Pantoea sp. EABMAA-21]SNY78359.1 4-amino-4-deoxychorismate lyase [Pantoea sp. GL120224-02]
MWINGVEQFELSARDRAVQFGDGCFTTAAVVAGKIQLLNAHLQRLQEGCERLFIPLPDMAQLAEEMQHAANGQTQSVLKVILTPGVGGRGYSRTGCTTPTRILSLSPWPQHYTTLQQQGAALITSPVRLARNPLLAGLKHLNRLEQVLIRQQLDYTDADEALVLDTAGTVVECCAANLFWRKGDQVFTPRLEQAGVDGIMRRYLMAQIASEGQACQLIEGSREDVLNADEVVICNALMPVLPVRKIDDVSFTARTLYQQLYNSCQKMEAS